MKILKGYLRNQYQPKGYIVEGYIAKEVIKFYNDYLSNVTVFEVLMSHHEGKIMGKGMLRT